MAAVRWLVVGFTIAWAGATMYLTVPIAVGAVLRLPAFPVFFDLQRKVIPRSASLIAAIASLRQASEWNETGALYTDLGFLELVRAQQPDLSDGERRAYIERAEKDLEKGLMLSPVQPQAWVRLALVRKFQNQDSPKVIEPLMMSFEVGAGVPSLAGPRMNLMLDYWWSLSVEQKVLAAKQVTVAWQHDRESVIRVAADPKKATIIEYALTTLPGAANQFRRLMARRPL